ncbi:hypothetical protein ACVRW4_04080 [Streptococcus phocae subsp. phocae]
MNKKAKQIFLILCGISILVTGIDMLLSGEYLRGITKLILAFGIFAVFSKDDS